MESIVDLVFSSLLFEIARLLQLWKWGMTTRYYELKKNQYNSQLPYMR